MSCNDVTLFANVMLISFFYRPGVIITEVHKRAGLDEEQYKQVKCGYGALQCHLIICLHSMAYLIFHT